MRPSSKCPNTLFDGIQLLNYRECTAVILSPAYTLERSGELWKTKHKNSVWAKPQACLTRVQD